MNISLAKTVSHREFLKICGLALVGASAGQLVIPPKPAAAYNYTSLTVSDNIGIGTETPTQSLHTTGSARVAGGHMIADQHMILNIGPNSGTKLWIRKNSVSGDPASFTNLMVVENTGKVGIGTAFPSYLLDVSAGWFRTTYNVQTLPPSSLDGGLAIGWNKTAGAAEVNFYNVYDNASTSYEFLQKTGASTANSLVTIKGNGNVGIGTTPETKLHLDSGAIRIGARTVVDGNGSYYA